MKQPFKKRILWILCIGLLLISAIVYGICQPFLMNSESQQEKQVTEEKIFETPKEETVIEKEKSVEDVALNEEQSIRVYICGAVKNPDVYEIAATARVVDLLEKAGGANKSADLSSINLAAALEDGQMVYVMTKKEAAASGEMNSQSVSAIAQSGIDSKSSMDSDGKININTADKELLMEIPGIGEAKAKSILAYRESHGAFSKIEDIMQIEGIKEGTFKKIKDMICVS